MRNVNTCDDRELVIRLRNGDYLAFDVLYEKYALQVARKIKHVIKSPELTEELHQEVFLRIWDQREKLDAENPFLPLLLCIARNVSIDYFRKASRSKQIQQRITKAYVELHCDVEAHVEFHETRAILYNAIEKLPPQRLKIFTLCKLEGKSYDEVATCLGVSVSTVKDHMHRAIRFLRREVFGRQDPNVLLIILILNLYIFFNS